MKVICQKFAVAAMNSWNRVAIALRSEEAGTYWGPGRTGERGTPCRARQTRAGSRLRVTTSSRRFGRTFMRLWFPVDIIASRGVLVARNVGIGEGSSSFTPLGLGGRVLHPAWFWQLVGARDLPGR